MFLKFSADFDWFYTKNVSHNLSTNLNFRQKLPSCEFLHFWWKMWISAKSVVLTYLNNGRQISILEGKLIFAKVISYHFWSNRARTLLTSPFASKLLPLRAGHLSTLPQGHASIPGQIRWFTGPPPSPFVCSLHVMCYFSFLTLYRENNIFGWKYPFPESKSIGLFTLHTFRKLSIFWCKPHLNWMITSSLNISIHTWQKY